MVTNEPARRDAAKHTGRGALPAVRLIALAAVFATALFFMTAVRSHTSETTGAELDGLTRQLGWVTMPAGARPAYFGIHGGTVPVSLLATREGTGLVVFVGRTGNDFLDLLHRAETRVPSLLNATQPRTQDLSINRLAAASRHLVAGSATLSLPVFSLSDDRLASMATSAGGLQPFGLSSRPLIIEGQIAGPDTASQAPRYHLFVDPQFLQPRRD